MEGDLVVIVAAAAFGIARLPILLSLGQLSDDRNSYEFLARELDGRLDRLLVLELDIADTVNPFSIVRKDRRRGAS